MGTDGQRGKSEDETLANLIVNESKSIMAFVPWGIKLIPSEHYQLLRIFFIDSSGENPFEWISF